MDRKLLIAVATHFFPTSSQPQRGRPIYEITRALRKVADVQVFCVDPVYPRQRFLRPRTFLNPEVATFCTEVDAQVKYLRYSALPLVTRPINGYNCSRALLPHLRQCRPDLIIAYNTYPEGFGSLLAGNILKVPVIVGALGSDLRRIRGFIERRLVRWTLRESAFVITVSNELRERALAFGVSPQKCRTIHNGCDFKVFRPATRAAARLGLKLDPRAEIILFTGRLVAPKGLRELFEAVAILARSRPRVLAVCIGEGPLAPELHQRASRSDLETHVVFTGGIDPCEVARWLAASDVFCLPSHSEGCPNVVIEALSCGRPVVATNVGGIPELLDSHCGVLVPPQSVHELAAGLSQALERRWNHDEIANSFHRSWDDIAQETYGVCCSVIGNNMFAEVSI
jgi:glycosyltransferase involved in cell wall biosynthesis